MIPYGYGGIDRVYGDMSIEQADKILDIIDLVQDILEVLDDNNDTNNKKENK